MSEEFEKQSEKYLSHIYSTLKNPKNEYPQKLAEHISLNYFNNKKGSLLDAGCGRGDMLRAFQNLNYNVEGIDLSSESINLCKPIEVKKLNLENQNINLGKNYEYIFSKSIIEHLEKPLNYLRNCHLFLKEKGKLVIMTPSWHHFYWGPFYLDFTHKTPFTIMSLRNALELSGFKNVKVEYFYQLPVQWKYSKVKILSTLIRKLPIPYSPMHDVSWPDNLNKFIRFSNEVMLLASCEK
jgi:2-polyprenyl-3-methyl-5-hydroxy-6-metoxy-1,4-benzoquinol methylase